MTSGQILRQKTHTIQRSSVAKLGTQFNIAITLRVTSGGQQGAKNSSKGWIADVRSCVAGDGKIRTIYLCGLIR